MSDTHDGQSAAPDPQNPAADPQRPADDAPRQTPPSGWALPSHPAGPAPSSGHTAPPTSPSGAAPAAAASSATGAPRIPPVPPMMPAGYGPAAPRSPFASAPGGVAAPGRAPSYAGAAYAGGSYAGASFGPAADTQPTLPLGPTGHGPSGGTSGTAVRTPRAKVGAGKIAALLVAAALVGGAAGIGGGYAGVQIAGPASQSSTASGGGGTVVVNDTESVTQTTGIAAKVMPSVVTIEVSAAGSGGTGSGVILSEDGYVVTNTHVVTLDGASDEGAIRVTTSDGRIFAAEIVGLDPLYDLAVIKLVDAEDLEPIEFASSSKLNVGDVTVAIGAPLGLANTVTTGIVSALGRSIEIASSAVPDTAEGDTDADPEEEDGSQGGPFQFDIPGQPNSSGTGESIKIAVIQTDAAINPGNSGGALVDSEGKLIGINVAIATAGSGMSEGAGSIGVGFSIPSDIVQRVTDEIIADGEATHGLLGATVRSAASLEDATIAGAYIEDVVDGGAAAAAGLRQGDVVTSFNGVTVSDSIDLTALVRAEAAGSEAEVTFVRDGKTRTIEVTLGTLES